MRRAEIRTELDRPEVVADAIRPDNTPELRTQVEDGAVVTAIERETTGGLRSTVDDYVVNLDVAARTIENATRHADGGQADGDDADDNPRDDADDDPHTTRQ